MKTISLIGKFVFITAFALFIAACEDDNDKLNVSFDYEESIDRIYVWDTSDIVGDGRTTVEWASSISVEFVKGSDRKYYFMLPDQATDGTADITLTLKTGSGTASATRTIPVAQMENHRKYGLGYKITEERANDVPYYWYVDQNDTGASSNNNCGPAVTEMVGKWAKEDFAMTAEEMRDDSGVTGNWTTNNISAYLQSNGVSRRNISFEDFEGLKEELDAGNIAIVCIDIYYVRTESSSGLSEWRKDKFYTTSSSSGHFVVVKGYKKVDGEYLLECYDPWSIGRKYENGQFKGLDRYYRLSDVLLAAKDWWKYAIIVASTKTRSGFFGGINTLWESEGLDPETIPEQWG